MKTTILLISFLLIGYTSSARVTTAGKVNKRNIYNDASLYASHGLLANDPITVHNTDNYRIQNQQILLPSLVKTPYSLDFDSFGLTGSSFLPQFPSNGLNYRPTTISNAAFDGYNYPAPIGQRFEEGPVPNSFEIVIQPAMRKLPIPNQNLPPGFRATMLTRRILTPENEGWFFRYPGNIPEDGLPVRVPIANTRPTRVVVPQHNAIAFGSGGLGYSYLPGGRIAIGSGSLGVSNVAQARANLLPPRQNPQKQTNPILTFPPEFNFLRRQDVDVSNSSVVQNNQSTSNDLTVFPRSDDDRIIQMALDNYQ